MNSKKEKIIIKNFLRKGEVVDIAKFDTYGFEHPIEALRLLQEIIGGNKEGVYIFKCTCGKYFVFPVNEVNKVEERVKDSNLLCNECAPKGTKVYFKVTVNDDKNIGEVETVIDSLFDKCIKNNKFSFCYYLWSVLPKSKNVDTVFDTISSFQSVVGRISSEHIAEKINIKLPEIFGEFHKDTDLVMMLMIYCHIHEMVDLLDILFVLLLISTSEYRSIVKDDRGFNALKLPPTGLIKNDVYDKLKIIIKISKTAGYNDLTELLRNIYKVYIRNAVYHSQYKITENSIIFKYRPDYKENIYLEKEITIQDFKTLYLKMMSFHLRLLEKLSTEREKLIKEGGVKENGMTLTPIYRDGGLSIKIEWSSN